MLQTVFIGVAGALGALCRWGISRAGYALFGTGFAWGTLIANVLGCFLLGFLMYLGLNTDRIPEAFRTAIAIGFLGALTTFSTFSYETIGYIDDCAWLLASLNIAANLFIGLGATIAGLLLAKTLIGAAV